MLFIYSVILLLCFFLWKIRHSRTMLTNHIEYSTSRSIPSLAQSCTTSDDFCVLLKYVMLSPIWADDPGNHIHLVEPKPALKLRLLPLSPLMGRVHTLEGRLLWSLWCCKGLLRWLFKCAVSEARRLNLIGMGALSASKLHVV